MHYTRHGAYTACGKLIGVAWGPDKLKATRDPKQVTCRKCRGHMRKELKG